MPTSMFTSCQPIASYDQAKLHQQFALLAQVTAGHFHPAALKLDMQAQELVDNLHWRDFTGNILLQRTWVVLVVIQLFLPKTLRGQMRFSNAYGETSGTPLLGSARLESNWSLPTLTSLLPPDAYWQLALAKEPFTLLLNNNQVSLTTYRFYSSRFYFATLDYLASLAERSLASSDNVLDATPANRLVQIPWSKSNICQPD